MEHQQRGKPSIPSPITEASDSGMQIEKQANDSPRVLLTLNHPSSGVAARSYYDDGEIVVLEGFYRNWCIVQGQSVCAFASAASR